MKTRINVFTLAVATVLSLGLTQTALAKGPPNKVEVASAYPGEAFQAEVLDVTVTGSNFDDGSTVSYLVTGTTDASQVEIISVEFISETQLKTRIRPKDNALPTDYDIEVQTTSGRKGKGTTLFKVKATETTCTGTEDLAPTIAYLSELVLTPEIGTADFYLASDSGCDQYLLLGNADETVFTNDGFDEVSSPWDLRLDYEDISSPEGSEGLGVVVWRNISRTHGLRAILGLSFIFDGTQVLADPAGPQPIYVPPDDWYPRTWDVRIDSSGGLELVSVETPLDIHEESDTARLAYTHVDNPVHEVLLEGNCPVLDWAGLCYQLAADSAWWDATGDEIYFEVRQWPDGAYSAIARMRRMNGSWLAPEVLVTDDNDLDIMGIRSDSLLSYRRLEIEYRKNGRVASRRTVHSIIDPESCVPVACSALDSPALPVSGSWVHGRWTRDGGFLYSNPEGNKRTIRKFSDPEFGIDANFQPLGPVHNAKWQCDTSF